MEEFTLPNQFFVPYVGNTPAVVSINGHRLVLLSNDEETLEDHLELIGAESVHRFSDDDFESTDAMLRGLAEAARAELVFTPSEIELPMFLNGLRFALPWSH